ncbi:hypothetical protein [Alteribacillus sp. HJP-4]
MSLSIQLLIFLSAGLLIAGVLLQNILIAAAALILAVVAEKRWHN